MRKNDDQNYATIRGVLTLYSREVPVIPAIS